MMFTYTREEIENLLGSLKYRESGKIKEYEEVKDFIPRYMLYAIVTIVGGEQTIDTCSLMDMLNYKTVYENFVRCGDINNLVHYIPLRKVPLYINLFPDFAQWRLRIGK